MSLVLLGAALILAVVSLTVKKSVTAVIAFALMMLLLGIYYLTLHEVFLGLFQIFVYTGGISVLVLFGVTLIGLEFPDIRPRPWAAAGAALFTATLIMLFWRNHDLLHAVVTPADIEPKALFAASYGDFVILFALIGTSLLYGTICMARVLGRRKDV